MIVCPACSHEHAGPADVCPDCRGELLQLAADAAVRRRDPILRQLIRQPWKWWALPPNGPSEHGYQP